MPCEAANEKTDIEGKKRKNYCYSVAKKGEKRKKLNLRLW